VGLKPIARCKYNLNLKERITMRIEKHLLTFALTLLVVIFLLALTKLWAQELISPDQAAEELYMDAFKALGGEYAFCTLPAGWTGSKAQQDQFLLDWRIKNPDLELLYIAPIIGFDSTGVRATAPVLVKKVRR